MTKQFHHYALIIGAGLLPYAACALTPGTGHVQIKSIQSYSGTPLTRPASIVIYDFAATPEEVELNKAALNRVRMRMSGAREGEKSKLAHEIVDSFSESLIKDLEKTGIPVSKGVRENSRPITSSRCKATFCS